ncbi:MAG: DNA primase [Firmicutes bacterium]|nr:DNA primase [Bacillota bacterium]
MYLDEALIEKIKEANDIVDVIGEYVSLKKRGQNFVGLCPFHNEKTPSFNVNPNMGIYKCFGCNESGDVIEFIKKYESLEFNEAVRLLADRAHIPIEEEKNINHDETNKFYEINKEAGYFYIENLRKSKLAMEYLKSRNISYEYAMKFGIGYAPDSWNMTTNYLKSKGYTTEEIEEANLIKKSEKTGDYYDLFRSRLMFPIIDLKGRVVGFSGRIIGDGEPKYYNSSESKGFIKGNLLYGLNMVKKSTNRDKIMLVEGNIDVVKLHQMGINYVVAPLGTAFTERQAQLLKRFGEEIYLCLDGDSAGRKATLRDIETLENIGAEPKIVVIPNGLDPDEYIDRFGVESFTSLLFSAKSAFSFAIEYYKEGLDINKREDYLVFIRQILAFINRLPDELSKEVYLKEISEDYDISMEALKSQIKESALPWDTNAEFRVPKSENISPRLLINLALTEKANAIVLKESGVVDMLAMENFKYIFDKIIELYEEKEVIDKEDLINKLKSEGRNYSLGWLRKLELSSKETEKSIEDVITGIKASDRQNKIDNILEELKENKDETRQIELLEMLDELKLE